MAEDAADSNVGSATMGGDEHQQNNTHSKKRQLDDGNQNEKSNKRRRKNKNKKNKAQGKKHNQKRHKKKWNNWIETCSESVNRIPANCAAPLSCLISRVEIEEESLLPKGVAGVTDDGKDATAADADVRPLNDRVQVFSSHEYTTSATSDDGTDTPANKEPANIAAPSISFVSQHANKSPWKVSSTIQVDGEEKKLFIPVKRHASTTGPTEWAQKRKKNGKQPSKYIHLPGGDNGDGITNPYPSSLVPDKFWAQRKRLFHRYDEGVQIGGKGDPEMWYSVTPESIANHVAERMVNMIRDGGRPASDENNNGNKTGNENNVRDIVIIDAFCGCGGNSIAFARLNNETKKQDGGEQSGPSRVKVIAVDNSLSRLKMAANNAMIYGIDKKDIIFVHADAVEVLHQYNQGCRDKKEVVNVEDTDAKADKATVTSAGFAVGGLELLPDYLDGIFLSPPWGGMDYGNEGGSAGFDPVSHITITSTSEHTQQDDSGDKVQSTEGTSVTTNGGELLLTSTNAVFNDSKKEGVISYFLPRNTSGICMGQIAVSSGMKGCFEMEQNVVNGKVKTVTAYFGHAVQ